MSEDLLYRQYLDGDQRAGDQLMLDLGDALVAYLDAFLHNAQDAEDLMLDSFADIFVRKPSVREGHFRAYLYKVARNKANRLWRLRFKRNEFSLEEAPELQAAPMEETVIKGEQRAALRRCLLRIAPQYREVLYLYYDMDMSYAQAAETLGCSTKKVEDLLRNGKKSLRKELEKEGITHADI